MLNMLEAHISNVLDAHADVYDVCVCVDIHTVTRLDALANSAYLDVS